MGLEDYIKNDIGNTTVSLCKLGYGAYCTAALAVSAGVGLHCFNWYDSNWKKENIALWGGVAAAVVSGVVLLKVAKKLRKKYEIYISKKKTVPTYFLNNKDWRKKVLPAIEHYEKLHKCKKLVNREPENLGAHTQLGELYTKTQYHETGDGAIEEFWKVLALNPDCESAYIKIIRYYREKNLGFGKAIAGFEEMLRQNPKNNLAKQYFLTAIAEDTTQFVSKLSGSGAKK